MPTYQYKCKQCDNRLEAVQSFSDEPLTGCPSCGGPLRKVFSTVGVVFKGSGFYRNDNRSVSANGKSDEAAAKAESSASSAADTSGSKAESKADGKSGAKSGSTSESTSDAKSGSSSGAKSESKPSSRVEPSTASKSA